MNVSESADNRGTGRKTAGAALVSLALFLCAAEPGRATGSSPVQPIFVDFYFEPGCSECFTVREEILPGLQGRFGEACVLREFDLGIRTNYLNLLALMESAGTEENARVYMLVDDADLLVGLDRIATGLVSCVERRLVAKLSASPTPSKPSPPAPSPSEEDVLAGRLRRFTFGGVAAAGLIDGINPCAFSTLVFLISVLSLAGTTGRRLLAVGAVFCLASFVTYTAIGLGLLHALHALSYFHLLQRIADVILLVLLAALAFLSFRDAARFRATHRTADVSLQLPDGIKRLIHRLLRHGLGKRAQLAAAFLVGAAVTALESVCTGQVYVPTLAMVIKSGANPARAAGYLLLYNLMFVLPLIAVFLLTWRGLELAKLLAWSARNVVLSKVLMGFLFLGLAVAILALR